MSGTAEDSRPPLTPSGGLGVSPMMPTGSVKSWGLRVRAGREGEAWGPHRGWEGPPTACLPRPSPAYLHRLAHLAWAERLISGMGGEGSECRGWVSNRFPSPTGAAGAREEDTPSLPHEPSVVRGQPICLWPAWLGPSSHHCPCVPVWSPGLALPLTPRQAALPVLAGEWLDALLLTTRTKPEAPAGCPR